MDSNPFRGLSPFAEGETLFEREADVDLMKSRLWSTRYTILFAASGVGKTSFLRAKLVPALRDVLGPSNVTMLDSWTEPDPVLALKTFRLASGKNHMPGTSVLVLDQFEEIFQSFPNVVMFNALGRELAAFSGNSSSTDIRVLLSVREEFLADLSPFEDFMPGLFTNYYRLERFTVQQARSIIINTTGTINRKVSPNVDLLLDDLRKMRSQLAENSNAIDPPYLQIACHRIWEGEPPAAGDEFLASYRKGQAAEELEAYTREKLEPLRWREKVLLSKALEHLTGTHEAKKYLELRDLAHQIGTKDYSALRDTLNPLCQEDVRILKGRNDVYGLYHDMYAPMLWKWREEQVRKQQTVRVALTAVISLAISFFLLYPLAKWWKVRDAMDNPQYGNHYDYANVLDMRDAMSTTVIWRWVGNGLWREYNDKLASLAAMRMDSDAAVLYRLASLSVSGAPAQQRDIEYVVGPELQLLGTLDSGSSDGIRDATILPERYGRSKSVLAVTSSGRLKNISFEEDKDRDTVDEKNVELKMPEMPAASNTNGTQQQVNVLGFIPGTAEVLVAWVGPRDTSSTGVGVGDRSKFVIHLTSFSARSGEPTNTYAFNLPTYTREAVKAETQQEGTVEIPPGVLFALHQIEVAFSPSRRMLAVLLNDQVSVLRAGFPAVRVNASGVDKLGFASEKMLVVATKSHGPGKRPSSPDETVQFCNLSELMASYACSDAGSGLTLRPDARLVFDRYGSVLLQANSVWTWIPTSTGSSRRTLDIPGDVLGFAPQVFDEGTGVIVAKDVKQRILLNYVNTDAATTSGANATVILASTEPRFQAGSTFTPASRTFTTSSLLGLRDYRIFLSLDNNGRFARLWYLPPKTSTPALAAINTPSAGINPNALTGGKSSEQACPYDSVDHRWKACLSSSRLSVNESDSKGGESWSVSGLSNGKPLSTLVSSTGHRVLLFYTDEVVLAERDHDAAVGLPLRCYRSGQVVQGTFGPGEMRVTFLTPEGIAIHIPSVSWPKCASPSTGKAAPSPEWEAGASTGFVNLLSKTSDERGVVLFSERWAHRLTVGSNTWPNITSVFSEIPIQGLEAPDLKNNQHVRIPNTQNSLSFDREQSRYESIGNGMLRAFVSSPVFLVPCDHSSGGEK